MIQSNKIRIYNMKIKSFFGGNEYYLLITETFKDVRLVGAPPSSIGKFGGDTDNWMWPRHTGDFSLFRVYMAENGSPAEYSKDNVPYKPKHHLPIQLNGVENGDYTMIFGFPGSTDRYLTSYGVKQALNISNPTIVQIREEKLSILKDGMDANKRTKIQYASKYASISNYWKYYIGQSKGLKRMRVYDKKIEIENLLKLNEQSLFSRVLKISTYNDTINKISIDTGHISKQYCNLKGGLGGGLKMPKLIELYEILFGKKFSDAHDAAYDLNATAKSFFYLLKNK